MNFNEYQRLAARTINLELYHEEMVDHALHGLSAEVGELHGIYQKVFQGHEWDEEHAKKELGDILWMIAEYCTALGWSMSDIAQMNISKLMERYPNGFNSAESIHRKDGDI